MNENQDDQNNQQQKIKKRNFSLDEKRNYCMAWKRSTMSQDHFCKTNGISKSALYNWVKAFKKNKEDALHQIWISSLFVDLLGNFLSAHSRNIFRTGKRSLDEL